MEAAADLGLETPGRGARRHRAGPGRRPRGAGGRGQRPRSRHVRHRSPPPARPGRVDPTGTGRGGRVGHPHQGRRRRRRAGGRRCHPGRIHPDDGTRSGGQARRAPRPAAGQGVRAHPPGGRGGGRGRRRRPRRVRAGPGEPARRRAVLPTPDGMLSVAVWVGEAGAGPEPTSTRSTPARKERCGGGDADLLRRGRKVASFVDRAWGGEGTAHWAEAAATPGRVVLAGGLDPGNVAEAIDVVHPWAVDAASSLESSPGIKDPDRVRRVRRRGQGGRGMTPPEPVETYGPYGGRYVPRPSSGRSTSWRRPTCPPRDDPPSAPSSRTCSRRTWAADAPHPRRPRLRRRAALPEARGPLPHRRPQDQQRPRAGAAGLADGQAPDHRRDRGRPARRRHRHRLRALSASTASSTWARVDMARQRLNVIRMQLLGAEVRPGRLRHRHAEGRASTRRSATG